MKTVYLAGPIAGCTQGEAKDWRAYAASALADHGIRTISPLRCEPIVGAVYQLNYACPKFGSARAIAAKNEFDTRACDFVLAYFPAAMNAKRPSIGTLIECGWAHAWGKQIIVVTDDPYYAAHPLLNACAGWMLNDLDDAIEVLVGVLKDYGRAA